MTWIFEKNHPMGGAAGEAFSNVLLATGLDPSGVLAREAIQNSVDAFDQRQGDKVKVAFRQEMLTGDAKSSLVSKLGLLQLVQRKWAFDQQPGSCIDTLEIFEQPLGILLIEDFGTHGLSGEPHSSHSHFYRLLLSLGDGAKARISDKTGGSYGYGKAVYSANSRIHTIVAYSVYQDNEHPDDCCHSVLMGCSYFRSHSYGGSDYTGRAWFGVPAANQPDVVDPFADGDADHLAAALGFTPRGSGSTGTSVMIVDCQVNTDELRGSIEDWWWPRILEDDLDVEIWESKVRTQPP